MRNAVFILVLFCHAGFSQIAIDGLHLDWELKEALVEDIGDNGDLDLLRVFVSNDEENLFIRFDADREFDIQDSENISIYIDVDNNPSTGFPINGIGSEITYYFGNRQGFINNATSFIQTNHAGLGMIALPTVTSEVFEISFSRRIESVLGLTEMGDKISISIENGNFGDKIPNANGGVIYEMQENEKFKAEFSFQKKDESLNRILSYNILRDGFEENSQKPHLEAVIEAVNPDIIAFQEIYGTPLPSIQDFLNTRLPNEDGSSWEYAKEGPDCVVFTRGVIEAHNNIDGNGVFVLNSKSGDDPIILYNVHLPCCDNDFERQREIDKIMSVVRDKADAPQINFQYPENAPIVIAGDFNMVGKSQNIKTFIEGDIENEIAFGSDFSPDWDDSELEDANPYITGFPSNYTWRNDNSSYNPGKLDFIFYSGSVMSKENSFVLATEFLTSEELSILGLSSSSTSLASDHLPVVADFSTGVKDIDMDGFTSDVDCNDFDPSINPSVEEIPNNQVDENCDGISLIIDEDEDGFNSDIDCNDSDASINPDALEIVNNDIDENCDGEAIIVDEDRDGFNSDEDCNDFDPNINPSMIEIINNDIDEDCDGIAQVVDVDMDGYNSDEDCNDMDANINPGVVEIPNNDVDENCDGELGIVDFDMDGFSSDVDCNDMDASINPASDEIANNDIDENCDGILLIIDLDMDGFNSDEDCNDLDSLINPLAEDIPNNGIDENCDGLDLISNVLDIEANSFELWPNPAGDFISVKFTNNSVVSLKITNSSGQQIFQQEVLKEANIDLSQVPDGIYFLSVIDQSSKLTTRTFIKLSR